MANHWVMKYQDEENEEQLRLNLDQIDEVRMDAEHITVRYKNLMARKGHPGYQKLGPWKAGA